METEDLEQVLLDGKYGKLSKYNLQKAPLRSTPLRLGEETIVYVRTLAEKIPLGHASEPLLALHRFKIWWMRPVFQHPVPPETLLLLEQVSGGDDRDNKNNDKDSSMVYRLVLPVVLPLHNAKSFASSSVRGILNDNGREELVLCSNHRETGLYVGTGQDPYKLIEEGVMLAAQLWNEPFSTKIENHDASPATGMAPKNNVVLQTLGWCTWNALYTNLNGPKIVENIRSLKQDRNIPIQWMIIDDGWQHITSRNLTEPTEPTELLGSSSVTGTDTTLDGNQWSQRLQSLREDPVKFKDLSLQETILQLRHDQGIQAVWVWHTLAGYWMGLNTTSPSFSGDSTSKLLYPHFPPGILDNDSSASLEPSVKDGIGIATDAVDFFQRYHTDFLSNTCGVDGIKVDAQGVVGIVKPQKTYGIVDLFVKDETGEDPRNAATAAPVIRLHDALAQNVSKTFAAKGLDNTAEESGSPSIIHCMAHAPEIFYRIPALYQQYSASSTRPLFRAADDFYPDNPHSHGPQIVACAFNSLLFQHIAIPDWDMFATATSIDPSILKCHAVARTVSGGPIYFSSSSEALLKSEERQPWVDWICCEDGTALPCCGTGTPERNCLLQDPLAPNAKPWIIWNTNGRLENGSGAITSGILGVFHMAGCGTWDYSKLTYVSNEGDKGSDSLKEDASMVELSPSMIPFFSEKEYKETTFLAMSFFSQHVQVLSSSKEKMSVSLRHLESEAVALFPLLRVPAQNEDTTVIANAAVLGLEGRINGGGAVMNLHVIGQSLEMSIRGCGDLLVAFRILDSGGALVSLAGDKVVSATINGDKAHHTIIRPSLDSRPATKSSKSAATLRHNLLELGFSAVVVQIPRCRLGSRVSIHFG